MTLDGGVEETSTGTINRRFDLTMPGIEKLIRIVVTSQDRSTTRGYTIAVTRDRADRNNAGLASIALLLDDDTPLLILTQPDEGTSFTYSARITGTADREVQTIEQITVSPQAADLAATMSIDGGVAEAMPDASVMLVAALDTPEAPIPIKVIAGDGTTSATYSLLITRVSSVDASLSSVVADGVTLMSGGDGTYATRLDEHTTSTTVTVRTTHSQATVAITLDGDTISAQNELSRPEVIVDSGDSRTLQIVVTAQDDKTSQTYTVTIMRARSQDIRLSMPEVSAGQLISAFVFDPLSEEHRQTGYSIELPHDIANTTITVMTANKHARLTIREANEPPSSMYRLIRQPIAIAAGTHTTATIVVTAQDGSTQTYTVVISRASAMDRIALGFMLNLSGINLENESATTYISQLSSATTNTIASASVTAAGVSIQSIRLNDDLQEYVEGSNPLHLDANMSATTVSQIIPLLRDENRITIVLRRADNTEDGYTEVNYIASVRRAVLRQETLLRVQLRVFLEGLLRTVPP